MRLNNKGFAISTIMYMILIMAIVLIVLTLTLLSSRKLILDRTKKEALDNIYKEYVCKPVTQQTASYDTAGNLVGSIPLGNYIPGDEYICEVKDNTFYHFYVLSVDGNKVNLILDRNVYYDEDTGTSGLADENNKGTVAWISETDYGCGVDGDKCSQADKGPVTAIEYLNNATSDWSNISNLNEIHDDEGENYSGLELTGKARLPKYSEVSAEEVGCKGTPGTCPLWLVNYTDYNYLGYGTPDFYTTRQYISGINGHYTLYTTGMTSSAIITDNGNLVGISLSSTYTVRPVITVLKSDIL